MSEPAEQRQNSVETEEEGFLDFMRRMRGSAPPLPPDRRTAEERLAIWDEFCKAVNAIEDEPIGEFERVHFGRELAL